MPCIDALESQVRIKFGVLKFGSGSSVKLLRVELRFEFKKPRGHNTTEARSSLMQMRVELGSRTKFLEIWLPLSEKLDDRVGMRSLVR